MEKPVLFNHHNLPISIIFQCQFNISLLYFSGDGEEDFMNLALKEGGISVNINLGLGAFETEVRPRKGTVRFDDNRWHKLSVVREAREVRILFIFIDLEDFSY